jgi:hypothetical protein
LSLFNWASFRQAKAATQTGAFFVTISGISFHTVKTDEGILVDTNIDLCKLNTFYHKKISAEHSSITPATILTNIPRVESDLYFSSLNLSELVSSNLSAKLAERKFDYIMTRTTKSQVVLSSFTGFIFKDAKAIREAVNSGRIALDDLLTFLKSSKRFKKWVVNIPPEANLIHSYYQAYLPHTIRKYCLI